MIIIIIYQKAVVIFIYWNAEVDSLNINVSCLLTASSLLSYFKIGRKILQDEETHAYAIDQVWKDISSIFHAKKAMDQIPACSLPA